MLPAGFNPRTMQFAQELRDQVLPGAATDRRAQDVQLVNAVLDHFRRGGYGYTLEPPALGRHSIDEFLFDTRLGFCEHYASAFVFLMRLLEVPARVVTGYQGGEQNPVDGFMTVRQSDAHAWAEVWLQGQGWVRIDPTSVVAPVRIQSGAGEVARQAGRGSTATGTDVPWLRALRYNWEAVENSWNQWVLTYSHGAAAGAGRATGPRAQAGERHHAACAHHGRTARVARVRLAATATGARSAGCVLPVAARAA